MPCASAGRRTSPSSPRQTRLTFARCGIVDPLSLADYRAHGGLTGLERARELGRAGDRGGGDGFRPARARRRGLPDRHQVEDRRARPARDQKYIVCNADEGDSGTFADRMLMEGDPFALIEGMTIAGLAVGATQGLYLHAAPNIRTPSPPCDAAIAHRRAELSRRDVRSRQAFDLEVRVGAGAYICGEETAMLESLEGKRGMVRAKPPLPAHRGAVRPADRNQQSSSPWPPSRSSWRKALSFYRDFGMGRSRGTMPIQLAGNVRHGGLFETAFGMTLGEMVDDIGGGTASGRPVRAVQVGGPLGAYFPPALFDTPYRLRGLRRARRAARPWRRRGVRRHAWTWREMARFAMEFCAVESCGKCTPCRIGSSRGVEVIDRIIARRARRPNLALLRRSLRHHEVGSLCALGGFTP